MNLKSAITFENVSLKFRNNYSLFSNLSFKVPHTGCSLLLGQTGSGKSSIFSIIKGIIPFINQQYISGSIQILSKKISNGNYYQLCKNVGLLTQNPEILSIETTLEYDIAFTLESLNYQKGEIRKKIEQLKASYSIINRLLERNPKNASAGEITLVQIIIMLLTNPQIILLDEPFSVLDYKQKLVVLDILKRMKTAKSIVVITHDIEILLPLIDYVIILDKIHKNLAFEGSKEEFLSVISQFKWIEKPILLEI